VTDDELAARERAERGAVAEGIENALEIDRADGPLVRWITIAETVTADGRRLLAWSSGADGETLPTWDESGFLFEALHHRDEWEDPAADDDPADDPLA
jgi:hypothetical protein